MDIGKLKAWWSEVERDRKIMLAAIGLSLVSQFFTYKKGGGGYLTRATDTNYYTGLVLTGGFGGTGWQLHKLALPLLAALAFIYLSKTWQRVWWTKWGWWVACVMLFLTITPADPMSTLGGFMGLVALGLAVWAAITHRKAGGGAP